MKSIILVLCLNIVIDFFSFGYELSDKALKIVNKEYDLRQTTCVIWWHTDSDDINIFLKKYQGTIATFHIGQTKTNEINKFHRFVKYRQTVFFAADSEEFKEFLDMVKDSIVSTIQMVLIITKPVSSSDVLREFTEIAWKNDVGYIIIISRKNGYNEIELTAYNPFTEGRCDNYKPIQVADNGRNYFIRNYANFHQCPIRFTALQFPPFFLFETANGTVTYVGGIDGEILKLILERLNASMDIVSSTDHGGIGVFVNGTATGSFGDLVRGAADTMALAIIQSYERHSVAQLTYVYATLDVVWCGPNRREISAWAKVLLPFFTTITPFLLLSFILTIVLVMLVQRFGNAGTEKRSKVSIVLYQTLGLFIGQDINYMSRYWLTNSVFVLWIWFCLIVRVVYQSDLVEGFQRTILEPHLTTVEDALSSIDGYGGVPGFLEFYHNTSIEKNYNKLPLNETPNYIKEIANGKRYLMAVDVLFVKYLNLTFSVQILDERVTRIPICLFTRPRWPAAEEFNRIIVHIAEAGFVAKIIRDHTNFWLSHSNVTEVESVKPINFSTLSACFYGLIVMCIICTVILGFEMLHYKHKSPRNK